MHRLSTNTKYILTVLLTDKIPAIWIVFVKDQHFEISSFSYVNKEWKKLELHLTKFLIQLYLVSYICNPIGLTIFNALLP